MENTPSAKAGNSSRGSGSTVSQIPNRPRASNQPYMGPTFKVKFVNYAKT